MKNVLFCESDNFFAIRMKFLINSSLEGGVNFFVASGEKEALMEIKQRQFDLIVIDIGEQLDGSLIKKIKVNPGCKDIPIIPIVSTEAVKHFFYTANYY